MKQRNLLTLGIIGLFIFSCNKDTDNPGLPNNTSGPDCTIYMEQDADGNRTKTYFDGSGKVTRVVTLTAPAYTDSTWIDYTYSSNVVTQKDQDGRVGHYYLNNNGYFDSIVDPEMPTLRQVLTMDANGKPKMLSVSLKDDPIFSRKIYYTWSGENIATETEEIINSGGTWIWEHTYTYQAEKDPTASLRRARTFGAHSQSLAIAKRTKLMGSVSDFTYAYEKDGNGNVFKKNITQDNGDKSSETYFWTCK